MVVHFAVCFFGYPIKVTYVLVGKLGNEYFFYLDKHFIKLVWLFKFSKQIQMKLYIFIFNGLSTNTADTFSEFLKE